MRGPWRVRRTRLIVCDGLTSRERTAACWLAHAHSIGSPGHDRPRQSRSCQAPTAGPALTRSSSRSSSTGRPSRSSPPTRPTGSSRSSGSPPTVDSDHDGAARQGALRRHPPEGDRTGARRPRGLRGEPVLRRRERRHQPRRAPRALRAHARRARDGRALRTGVARTSSAPMSVPPSSPTLQLDLGPARLRRGARRVDRHRRIRGLPDDRGPERDRRREGRRRLAQRPGEGSRRRRATRSPRTGRPARSA